MSKKKTMTYVAEESLSFISEKNNKQPFYGEQFLNSPIKKLKILQQSKNGENHGKVSQDQIMKKVL